MKHIRLFLLFLFIVIYTPAIYPKVVAVEERDEKPEKEDKVEPLEIGNFIVPTSQQIGPLFGFGQNILDAKDLQTFVSPNKLGGHNFHFSELLIYPIYAFTDYLSVFLAFPVAINKTEISNESTTKSRFFKNTTSTPSIAKSSGFEDMFLQVEYAYFDKKTLTTECQCTLVGAIFFPTGSAKKNPPTGNGSPAFFVGTTAMYQAQFLYVFTSFGGQKTTKKNGARFGSSFLYQCGVEGVIGTLDEKKWLFAWLIEVFGIRSWKDVISNQVNPNSGGNTVFIAPSLWISSNHLILQLGVGAPFFQKLNGIQNKTSYFLAANIAWTFHLK